MKIRFLRKRKKDHVQDLKQEQRQIQNKLRGERGASLVEYGLLVALIAVIVIPAVTTVGDSLNVKFVEAKDGVASGNFG